MRVARSVAGILVMAGLYLTSLYNYNLFHGLVEIFAVVVAASVFVVAWNGRAVSTNNYVLLLGCAFIYVAGVDLLHTLAYEGMQVFPNYDTDLPTQLWLVGPYLALALLAARSRYAIIGDPSCAWQASGRSRPSYWVSSSREHSRARSWWVRV